MVRKLRLEYPGAIYHVMNRGDRREAISSDDHATLSTSGRAKTKFLSVQTKIWQQANAVVQLTQIRGSARICGAAPGGYSQWKP